MNLHDRYRRTLEKITLYGKTYQNPNVSLLAVSKKQSIEKITQLAALGHTRFGENYAEELVGKATEITDPSICWSYIGALQSNKIARLIQHCDEIQTVASQKHARYIARYASELNKTPFPIYIQVNLGEKQKAGLPSEQVSSFAQWLDSESNGILCIQGVMSIPPADYSDAAWQDVPPLYQDLATLAKTIGKGKLSLGMSRDLRIAIAAGANEVRVGRDLFGDRPL